jgi:hypothetical protein
MELALGLMGAAAGALLALRRPSRLYWLVPLIGLLFVGSVLWAWGAGLADDCVPDCGTNSSVSGAIAAILGYAFVGLMTFVAGRWVYRRLSASQVPRRG